jgi:hypothetical protein
LIKRAPGTRSKSASLVKPLVKAGGAAPDRIGIAVVFGELKGK